VELGAKNATFTGYNTDEIRVGEALNRRCDLNGLYSNPRELLVGDRSALRPGCLWGELAFGSGDGHAEDQNHRKDGTINLWQNAEAFIG
jgi:hypothetical protein